MGVRVTVTVMICQRKYEIKLKERRKCFRERRKKDFIYSKVGLGRCSNRKNEYGIFGDWNMETSNKNIYMIRI